jgi:hypothetical protein
VISSEFSDFLLQRKLVEFNKKLFMDLVIAWIQFTSHIEKSLVEQTKDQLRVFEDPEG